MANFGIIYGEFHTAESKDMVDAARSVIEAMGHQVYKVVGVPGSYEVPLALKRMMMSDDCDGVVVLGIIERGETSHGAVMGKSVSDAIIALQLEFMKPVGMGILGPDIFPSQIPARVKPYAAAAAKAAIKMLDGA